MKSRKPNFLVKFKEKKDFKKYLKSLNLDKSLKHEFKHIHKDKTMLSLSREELAKLESLGLIDSVEELPNAPIKRLANPTTLPSYELFATPWDKTNSYHLDTTYNKVGVNGLQKGLTGTGVKVAVLDMGIDATHPSLQGKVVESVSFASNWFEDLEQVAPKLRPSVCISSQVAPFVIGPTNKNLSISIGGAPSKTISLTEGSLTASQVAYQINTQFGSSIASFDTWDDTGEQFVYISIAENTDMNKQVIWFDNITNRANETIGFPVHIPMEDLGIGAPVEDHGTHVGGLIIANYNPSNATDWKSDYGVTGVAPDVTYYHAKVLSAYDFGSFDWVLQALDWAVARGVDIINLSLGGEFPVGTYPVYDTAFKQVYDSGVLIVCASGNEGTFNHVDMKDCVSYPANLEFALAVSNVGCDMADDNAHDYDESYVSSSIGPRVDIGQYGDVWSTVPVVYYQDLSLTEPFECFTGTSMSAPIITGMCALYKQHYGSMINNIALRNLVMNFTKKGKNPVNGRYPNTENNPYFNQIVFGSGIATLPDFNTLLPKASIKTIGQTILDQTKLG